MFYFLAFVIAYFVTVLIWGINILVQGPVGIGLIQILISTFFLVLNTSNFIKLIKNERQ